MADAELKPCPFCGGEPILDTATNDEAAFIRCAGCNTEMWYYPEDDEKPRQAEWLRKKWNRRDTAPPQFDEADHPDPETNAADVLTQEMRGQ